MQPSQNQRNSLATGEYALARIAVFSQPADPKSYALWYRYAAGESGLLTAAVNARIARSGTLTAQDIQDIYSSHIGPAAVPEKIDRLSARIASEIGQAAATIGTAQRAAGSHSEELARTSQRLNAFEIGSDLRPLVAHLLKSAQEMAATNARLQSQLHAMWEEIAQLRRELAVVRAESQTDPLTSLGNGGFFTAALDKAVAECAAADEPLTLLLVDVDGIKSINETYGRIIGDRVLRFIAMTLREGIAGRDVAARLKDDEFGVILPRVQLAPAVRVGEQFRHAIMKCELIKRTTGEKQTRLTVSIGAATLHKGMLAQALLETAEQCLHAAKRAGRNCVVCEADEKLFAALGGTTISGAAIALPRA
jgi:diguanylate cyclase